MSSSFANGMAEYSESNNDTCTKLLCGGKGVADIYKNVVYWSQQTSAVDMHVVYISSVR